MLKKEKRPQNFKKKLEEEQQEILNLAFYVYMNRDMLLQYGEVMEPYAERYEKNYHNLVVSYQKVFEIIGIIEENMSFLSEQDISFYEDKITEELNRITHSFLEEENQYFHFFVTRELDSFTDKASFLNGMNVDLLCQMNKDIYQKAYTFPYDTALHFLMKKWEKEPLAQDFLHYVKEHAQETEMKPTVYPIIGQGSVVTDVALYLPKQDTLEITLDKIGAYTAAFSFYPYVGSRAPAEWPDTTEIVSVYQEDFLNEISHHFEKVIKIKP